MSNETTLSEDRPLNADDSTVRNGTFRIKGMSCANCVLAIEKGLGTLEGIRSVVVNLTAENMSVAYEPETVDDRAIRAKVKDLGFAAFPATDVSQRHSDRKSEARAARLWVLWTLLLSLPFILSMSRLGPPVPDFVFLIHASLALFTSGTEFYQGAYHALKNRLANMDVLVALSISSAYLYSLLVVVMPELFSGQKHFFEVVVFLLLFIRFGKYLEARAKDRAGKALERLLELQADRARIVQKGEEREIPASAIRVGDLMRVLPGETIPVDARVIEGRAAVDESIITGESIPVAKGPGDPVTGSTINTSGALLIEGTGVGKDTVLANIVRMVEAAQTDKAPIQRFADSVSHVFVPIVLGISILTFVVWYLLISSTAVFALTAAMAVLVIACPCALGLATPTAILVGSGIGLERGILIKRASALERIARLDTLFLDKTGTLTTGHPGVTDVIPIDDSTEDDILRYAAAGERSSTHPLAKAVVGEATTRNLELGQSSEIQEESGRGVIFQVDGHGLHAGNAHLMDLAKIDRTAVQVQADRLMAEGKTIVYVARDRIITGLIGLSDTVKQEAVEAVRRLKTLGIRTVMITGDHDRVARAVADTVDVDDVVSGVLPGQKSEMVTQYKKDGAAVGMVGDGINDAPALASADVGIAIGSGTDVAKQTGDIILARNNLLDVERAIQLGRATLRKIKQNLFWAFFYNTLGIPVAAGLFYPLFGILLKPEWAGLAMAFSSVSVVANALLLKRLKLM